MNIETNGVYITVVNGAHRTTLQPGDDLTIWPVQVQDAAAAAWTPDALAAWEAAQPSAADMLAQERAAMTVSRFQARAALMQAGLLSAVETAVAGADAMTQLAWAEAVEWNRNSPTIAAIGAALGLTDEQLDDLFRAAAAIRA